jgi:adenylyltransferase/sulfurtransferase
MNDQELLRYSRQIMLPDFDVVGQERLLSASVLLIGAGGLGSPIALYLAAAGIGSLTIVDDDGVDSSNLQRQIAHGEADLGINKAASAAAAIRALNPATHVTAIDHRLAEPELSQQIVKADLVLDATDNAESRYGLNAACWQAGKPLVSGAAIRWEGQVSVFDPRQPSSPCYRCLYPELGGDAALNCAENGVIAPLVGVIGSMQALEAIKHLAGTGSSLVGTVLFFDGKYGEWQRITLTKNPDCPICG